LQWELGAKRAERELKQGDLVMQGYIIIQPVNHKSMDKHFSLHCIGKHLILEMLSGGVFFPHLSSSFFFFFNFIRPFTQPKVKGNKSSPLQINFSRQNNDCKGSSVFRHDLSITEG